MSCNMRKRTFWRAPNKDKLACASAQSDQSISCILGYPEFVQWRFWANRSNAQACLNLCWKHVWRYVSYFVTQKVIYRNQALNSNATMNYQYVPASVAQLDARPTGDREVAGSTPAEVGNILSWRLIMKYFLRSFSPFCWFKKGSCQFLAKECAQYWLTA